MMRLVLRTGQVGIPNGRFRNAESRNRCKMHMNKTVHIPTL